jgi:hypothetical protein
MTGTVISTTITNGINFGPGTYGGVQGYAGPLTITTSGGVEPKYNFTPAIYVGTKAAGEKIVNLGQIDGGYGRYFSTRPGGVGVEILRA